MRGFWHNRIWRTMSHYHTIILLRIKVIEFQTKPYDNDWVDCWRLLPFAFGCCLFCSCLVFVGGGCCLKATLWPELGLELEIYNSVNLARPGLAGIDFTASISTSSTPLQPFLLLLLLLLVVQPLINHHRHRQQDHCFKLLRFQISLPCTPSITSPTWIYIALCLVLGE